MHSNLLLKEQKIKYTTDLGLLYFLYFLLKINHNLPYKYQV